MKYSQYTDSFDPCIEKLESYFDADYNVLI